MTFIDRLIKMDEELLERHGWTMCTIHPLEISHDDGSFARGLPAQLLLEHLREEED